MSRLATPSAVLCAALLIALARPSQASAAWKLRFVRRLPPRPQHQALDPLRRHPALLPRHALEAAPTSSFSGGILRLQNYRDRAYGGRWVSAGVSMGRSLNQTYGKYRVRFRITQGRRRRHVHAAVAEARLAARDRLRRGVLVGRLRRWETSTLHFGRDNSEIHHRVHANFTLWHTIGVNWRPGRLVYMLDGHAWARISGAEVPDVPMHLGIQTHVGTNGNTGSIPDSTTPAKVGLQIDWVKVYRYG